MYSYGPPHMAVQKQDDQFEHTFSSCVRILDVVLKTCLGWWTIGRSGERGSGISVLPARHDDDDDWPHFYCWNHKFSAYMKRVEGHIGRNVVIITIDWQCAASCSGGSLRRSIHDFIVNVIIYGAGDMSSKSGWGCLHFK